MIAPPERTLAVIGSRGFTDESQIAFAFTYYLPRFDCVVSGGARGADSIGERLAAEAGLRVVSYRPRSVTVEGREHFHVEKWIDGKNVGSSDETFPDFSHAARGRNWMIVRDAAEVLAFWDGMSFGAAHGIAAAARYGRTLRIWMDGDS